jgi:hypothetical protein
MKVVLQPLVGPTFQVVLATLPLLALLGICLYETFQRSRTPPYSIPEGTTDDAIKAGYDDAINALVGLREMVLVFMIVALMWTTIAVYLSFYRSKRENLVKQYLQEGTPIVGDVLCDDTGCRSSQLGELTYPHPKFDTYPIHWRRHVRVWDFCTRERVSVLLLPGYFKSGHIKSELEYEMAVIEQNEKKMNFIAMFAWCWVTFTYLAPLYILYVMGKSDREIDNPRQAWIVYLLSTLLVIPGIAVGSNWILWWRHFKWMTIGDAKAAEEGERISSGWLSITDNGDSEMVEYAPPTEVPSALTEC